MSEQKQLQNEDKFSEWYNDIIDKANLSDKRYPIKGMNVWTAYGWKVMRAIDNQIRREMERTSHDEVCFPLLIPEDQFAKEAQHIKGFDEQVYWVTHAGKNQLDIRLLLRPTSETAMYPMFSLWVRSHADLPLKIFQLVNTFRYETKQTRSFVRVREIHFFEAHTCHADFEDAERQIKQDCEIMERLSHDWCLPYQMSKRPNWDKFAGADYTFGVDIFMPTGKALQIASIHEYRNNFAKAYNIQYEAEDGTHKDAHQTTYGMSERIVGAMIGVHGDEKGLVMPPKVAPIQIVIIPILAKGKQETVLAECEKLADELRVPNKECGAAGSAAHDKIEGGIQENHDAGNGFRVHIDARDMRPGSKYFDWEIKGVPLRMELGPRDMEKDVVTIVRRDNGAKSEVSRKDLAAHINKTLAEISESLYAKADAMMKSHIKFYATLDELKAADAFARVPWCANDSCGQELCEVSGFTMLGTPAKESERTAEAQFAKGKKCVMCQKDAMTVARMAKTY